MAEHLDTDPEGGTDPSDAADGDVVTDHGSMRNPPALSRRLTDLWPPVIVGTMLWFAAFVVLLIAQVNSAAGPGVWLWTTLAGWVLGLVGFAIMAWQRGAARRGARGAHRDL